MTEAMNRENDLKEKLASAQADIERQAKLLEEAAAAYKALNEKYE